MKTIHLQYAITCMVNLLRSGISPSETLREMIHLQPAHKPFWQAAAQQAAQGVGLAKVMHPILDEAMYAALLAAEHSGTIVTTLESLEVAMEEKEKVKKTMRSMGYPFFMLLGALGVLLFYLGFVAPSIAHGQDTRPGQKPSMLQVVGDSINQFFSQYWIHISLITALAIIAGVLWLRDENNRNTLVGFFDQIPVIGPATRELFYGQWAGYMAINTHAGITVLDAIKLTNNILPAYYRNEVQLVAKDITRLGQAEAAAPRNPPDERNLLPYLIVNAFRLGERTGVTDENFRNASQALIKQGTTRINYFVKTANNIITPLAAILAGSAMLPYFFQISDTISHLH